MDMFSRYLDISFVPGTIFVFSDRVTHGRFSISQLYPEDEWPKGLEPVRPLNSQPSTLNPQPSTLNPQPSTLNP